MSFEKIKSYYRILKTKNNRLYTSLFGTAKYDKFIVVTSSRTGSNLLISYLNSHPNIEAKGELFRDLEGKTCKQVWGDFFYKKPKNIKLAGFKIFYYHPFHTKDRSVWDIILKDKSIKIIHLVRKNKLKAYLSREIASKTDSWSKKKDKSISIKDRQVEINFEEFESRLNEIENYEEETRRNFQDHDFLEISYENLVADKVSTMGQVFNILGLKENEFKSSYKKQNTEKTSDLILNYDDFSNNLKKSKYSYLFDLED